MDVLQQSRQGMQYFPGWLKREGVFESIRQCFEFETDRYGGYLIPDPGWPAPMALLGPGLLADLQSTFDLRFNVVTYQGYRDGTGCQWHTDAAYGNQAILSLGVTRTFGVRPNGEKATWWSVEHGDLVYMTSRWQQDNQHCVRTEEVPGERVSIVFRTLEGLN